MIITITPYMLLIGLNVLNPEYTDTEIQNILLYLPILTSKCWLTDSVI